MAVKLLQHTNVLIDNNVSYILKTVFDYLMLIYLNDRLNHDPSQIIYYNKYYH